MLFELMNATTAKGVGSLTTQTTASTANQYKTISDTLTELKGDLLDLYEEVRAHLNALGDDVQEKTLRFYVAFKRIKNFACVELRPSKGSLLIFLKINPDTIELEKGFTRDVRKIGHFGTGDLEVTITSKDDLEKAKVLLQKSYDAS